MDEGNPEIWQRFIPIGTDVEMLRFFTLAYEKNLC